MKRIFTITVVMLLSSAMVFVVVCAAGPMKPMRGSWSGKIYNIGTCQSGENQVLAIGKGHLNLIGAGDWVSWGCVAESYPIVSTGGAIITTATGDALFLHVVITFTFTGSNVGDWHQDEITIGGTGRFEGAVGVSSSDGTFDWNVTPGVWEGTNTEGYIDF